MVSLVLLSFVAFVSVPAVVGQWLKRQEAQEAEVRARAEAERRVWAMAERLGLAVVSASPDGTYRLLGTHGAMAVTLRVRAVPTWASAHLTVLDARILPSGPVVRTTAGPRPEHTLSPVGSQLSPAWRDVLRRWHPKDVRLSIEAGGFVAETSVASAEEAEDFTRDALDTLTVLAQTSAYR